MDNSQRHFTEEAFRSLTFVEFNKCWSSGKKSRLVIESMNGFVYVSFSAFLGHPKTMHFAPREKQDPGRKYKKKSKRKTQRDNERAARFQEGTRSFYRSSFYTFSPLSRVISNGRIHLLRACSDSQSRKLGSIVLRMLSPPKRCNTKLELIYSKKK